MSTLSEVYRDHPLHLHHIAPLDFSAVRTMPDSHVWRPESSNDFSFGELSSSPVPVIDLGDPNAPELIVQACETWGVFQLVNHGVLLSHIEEVEYEAGRFFALPTRQKLKALRTPCGATGYGVARITPFFSKYMWHEGFTIMGSPADHVRELWPHDYERFCDAMENYQKDMKGLAERLTRQIFDSLKISDEEISWLASTTGSGGSPPPPPPTASTALQLNSYPCCPDPNQAMGLAPHTDTSLLTILHQSETNGLQVFKPGLGWVLIPPVAGAFVVNIGDILHILSNARFPNALHRVVVNGSRQRFSVAYFYSPPTDYVVSLLYKGLNSGEDNIIPRYRSVAVKEYIGLKAKNLENALDSNNQFSGQLREFSNISSYMLQELDLSNNDLEGPIPMSIFEFRGLEILSFSSNNFDGSNLLIEYSGFNLSSPPFPQIASLGLASSKLEKIPDFLRNQSS